MGAWGAFVVFGGVGGCAGLSLFGCGLWGRIGGGGIDDAPE